MRHYRKARSTLNVVDMNINDELEFQLMNSDVKTIKLKDVHAGVHETNLAPEEKGRSGGITVYKLAIFLEIDGHRVQVVRTIGNDESFYEPYEFYGIRFWPDASQLPFNNATVTEAHGDCNPEVDLRIVIQDATLRICPPMLHAWCPLPKGGLKIKHCYNGDDCWLGAYFGRDAHGGLDINHQSGTKLWAPITFDRHEFFARLEDGDNNNRWRGYHEWADGSTWILQSHHMIDLLVPQDMPIMAGECYASSAGALCGNHEHSHFVFRIEDETGKYIIDPWILFWQMYKDREEATSITN